MFITESPKIGYYCAATYGALRKEGRGGGECVLAHHVDGKVFCSGCPGEVVKVGIHHKLASRVLQEINNFGPNSVIPDGP